MRKAELLPTRDGEAGYGPGDKLTDLMAKMLFIAWSSSHEGKLHGHPKWQCCTCIIGQ